MLRTRRGGRLQPRPDYLKLPHTHTCSDFNLFSATKPSQREQMRGKWLTQELKERGGQAEPPGEPFLMVTKPLRPLRRNAVPLPPHVWLHPRLYLAFNTKFLLPLWTLETESLHLFMQIWIGVRCLRHPTDLRISLRPSLKVRGEKRSSRRPFWVLKSDSDL